MHLIAPGKEKHCCQLIVAIDKKGKTHFKENLDKLLALTELQKIALEEDALQKEWLPKVMDSFPRLPGPLATALCPLHPDYCSPYPRWLQQILGMRDPD